MSFYQEKLDQSAQLANSAYKNSRNDYKTLRGGNMVIIDKSLSPQRMNEVGSSGMGNTMRTDYNQMGSVTGSQLKKQK